MPERTVDYEQGLYSRLREPKYAIEYLNACLEEGGCDLFLQALKDIIEAYKVITPTY